MRKWVHSKRRAQIVARRSLCGVLFVGVLFACLFVYARSPVNAATGINKQINYQARLLNNQGAVVPDGTYNVEFKIYQDGTGCVSSGSSPCGGTLKWTETRTGGDKVTVKNGYFSVALGSVTAFGTSVDWNQDSLWLSINIGGTGTPTWDGEMLPFRQLAATPYALNAGQLGGLDASKFLQIAPSAVQVDSGTLSSIYLNKTGASGNILQLQKNGADVMVLTNDGKLALGANSPAFKFEVQSGDMAVYNSGNNARIILGDSATTGQYGYMQWDSANDYFRIEKNGSNGMKINDNYVTIGNIYPDQPLQVANGTNLLFKVDTTGKTTHRTTTDAASAFEVQDNAGDPVFSVNTANNRVGINGINNPATALDVSGSIQQSGMTTLNTTGVNNNKWVRLGTCTITFQYQQCLTTLNILGGQDGTAGDFPQATVSARVKQQDPLGNAPLVDLQLNGAAKIITKDDIKTVTTTNTGASTVVELYGRITNQYDQWYYTSVMNTGRDGSASWVWTPEDPFQAALPAGVQTDAVYGNLYATAIQGTTSISTASLRPVADGLNAFKLQSTDATVTALTADTFNGRVAIGGDFGATENLDVKGSFQVRDAVTMTKSLRVRTNGGGIDMEASGANMVLSVWSGANYAGTQYNQITFKNDGSSMDFARGFNVSDGAAKVGLGGNINPQYPLDVTGDANVSGDYRVDGNIICTNTGCTPAAGSADYIQNLATAQSANLYVQAASSGSVAGVLQANAAGAGAILQLKNGAGTNVAVFGSTGAVTLQNSTDSTAGFQVLADTAGGSNAVLRVDTTNERVAIGVISDPIGAKLSVATSSTVSLRAFQGGASDTFQLGNGTADFMTVSSTGNLLVKPSTASASAMSVQIAGTSTNVFNVDTSGLKVNIGTADASGTLLVLDTKNDNTTDPSGTAGAMYYNSTAGVFRCYEGTAWVDCISKHIKAIGSDPTANSAVTLADATGLNFTVASGRTYRYSANIAYTSAATTTGINFGVNGPTNSLFSWTAQTSNTAGTGSILNSSTLNTAATAATGSISGTNMAVLDGIITTTASGTVQIRFASEVATSAITIKAGSTIEWW